MSAQPSPGLSFGPVYTRAAAMGFFFTVGNSAGLISSNVYPTKSRPRYIEGHSVAIGFASLAIICAIILYTHNKRENARRDRVYGVAAVDGSDASPRSGNKEKWGLEGLSDREVIELGDRHPGVFFFPSFVVMFGF